MNFYSIYVIIKVQIQLSIIAESLKLIKGTCEYINRNILKGYELEQEAFISKIFGQATQRKEHKNVNFCKSFHQNSKFFTTSYRLYNYSDVRKKNRGQHANEENE